MKSAVVQGMQQIEAMYLHKLVLNFQAEDDVLVEASFICSLCGFCQIKIKIYIWRMLTTSYNHNENNYKYNNSTSMVTWYTTWLQHA